MSKSLLQKHLRCNATHSRSNRMSNELRSIRLHGRSRPSAIRSVRPDSIRSIRPTQLSGYQSPETDWFCAILMEQTTPDRRGFDLAGCEHRRDTAKENSLAGAEVLHLNPIFFRKASSKSDSLAQFNVSIPLRVSQFREFTFNVTA